MLVQVNGEATELPEGASISALIEQMQLNGKRFAVELNGEIVPRSRHQRTLLRADDRVEIVQAIGGG